MAELLVSTRNLFDGGFKGCMRMHRPPYTAHGPFGTRDVPWYVVLDFDAAAKFFVAFIPEGPDPAEVCTYVFDEGRASMAGLDVVGEVRGGFQGQQGSTSTRDLVFSNRMVFYLERQVAPEVAESIIATGRQRGITAILRGPEYADTVNRTPKCFISYDSRDREDVAQPLALALVMKGIPVWYDRYALNIGDRVREKIEDGLRRCQRCVFVLSKSFLSNEGYPREEFDGVFDREREERKDLILPVWHGVTKAEVMAYCLSLGNRQAADWAEGCDKVAAKVASVLT